MPINISNISYQNPNQFGDYTNIKNIVDQVNTIDASMPHLLTFEPSVGTTARPGDFYVNDTSMYVRFGNA
jgi:hypothetical protein